MRALVLVLVWALLPGCARRHGGADASRAHAISDRTPPETTRWTPIAPGIRLAERELAYDETLAEVDVVRLDLAAVAFDVRKLEGQRFAPLIDEPGLDVAINGGFFERDLTSSGLVVAAGTTIAPANPRGGSGVLVIRDGRAALVASDALDVDLAATALALQCGPRLVESDGAIGIHRDDGRRAARTAVCLRDHGRTLDLVIARRRDGLGGPGLLTLATWLHQGLLPGEPGCEAALNLDGGPSTALYVRGAPSARRLPPGPVVDAVLVRSRVVPASSGSPMP